MSPTTLFEDTEVIHEDSEAAVEAFEVEVQRKLEPVESGPQHSAAPIVIPPLPSPSEVTPISPQRARLLNHIVKMADVYGRNGSSRQAIELYFELVNDHEGTNQALLACDRLMEIGQKYEDNGELRLARGIYERLLKVS